MRQKLKSSLEEDSAIDMTPMLDIVFIMLIFFIVTASFVKETGIDVSRPEASTAQAQEGVAILIAIDKNNQLWINRRQIDLAVLRANVERLRAENPRGGAVIQADKQASTGLLVDVMDRLRQAGVLKISIAASSSK